MNIISVRSLRLEARKVMHTRCASILAVVAPYVYWRLTEGYKDLKKVRIYIEWLADQPPAEDSKTFATYIAESCKLLDDHIMTSDDLEELGEIIRLT